MLEWEELTAQKGPSVRAWAVGEVMDASGGVVAASTHHPSAFPLLGAPVCSALWKSGKQ